MYEKFKFEFFFFKNQNTRNQKVVINEKKTINFTFNEKIKENQENSTYNSVIQMHVVLFADAVSRNE